MDPSQGLVFKQFHEEEAFEREILFLPRLAGFPWDLKVLGTMSHNGVWGVFMPDEGRPVRQGWSEVGQFVLMCMQQLHMMGIHHHDIAPRNVLRRRDGSLVLIDYANAVNSRECTDGDCPDEYPNEEFPE